MNRADTGFDNVIAEIVDGHVTHIMYQDEDCVLEERDFDSEMSPPDRVGAAKEATPGAYVLLGPKVGTLFYPRHVSSLLS